MIYWKEKTLKQFIASLIWNISEALDIPLGRYAKIVFETMTGFKEK